MEDFELQQALIEQRRKQYGQQSQAGAPQGAMVGNRFVAPNALQYIAAGLRQAGGLAGESMAADELKTLSGKRQSAIADALRNFGQTAQGTPQNAPIDGMGPTMPAQKPDMQAAYSALLQAPDSGLRQMGMQGMMKIPEMQAAQQEREDNRTFRAQESQLAREARAQELQTKIADGRASQAERLQAQKELREMMIQAQKDTQRMIAANRPERQAQIIQTESGPMQLIGGKAVPIQGPDGKPIAGKPGAGAGNVTEGERKAATLLQRMQGSESQLEAALLKDKGAAKPGLISSGLSALGMGTLANTATDENRQKVEAAQLDILDAALTLGTGAAYTKEQLEGYRKSYFPQLGDQPETVKDKQDRLNNVLSAARIAAGRASSQVPPLVAAGGSPATPKARLKFDAQGNAIP